MKREKIIQLLKLAISLALLLSFITCASSDKKDDEKDDKVKLDDAKQYEALLELPEIEYSEEEKIVKLDVVIDAVNNISQEAESKFKSKEYETALSKYQEMLDKYNKNIPEDYKQKDKFLAIYAYYVGKASIANIIIAIHTAGQSNYEKALSYVERADSYIKAFQQKYDGRQAEVINKISDSIERNRKALNILGRQHFEYKFDEYKNYAIAAGLEEDKTEMESYLEQMYELIEISRYTSFDQLNEYRKIIKRANVLFTNVSYKTYPKRKEYKVNGVEFAVRWCPPGRFTMGSPKSEYMREEDETQHEVDISQGFWMMETEITIEFFVEYLRSSSNLSGIDWSDDDCPIKQENGVITLSSNKFGSNMQQPMINVNWHAANRFAVWVSSNTGLDFKLPTEAQWEYAARAETKTTFYWGESFSPEFAWYSGNSPSTTQPVGMKMPNAWGLYDMSGNVWEWCLDKCEYDGIVVTDTYKDGVKDPLCEKGSKRIIRGGGWFNYAKFCRSADRGFYAPNNTYYNLGFRLCSVK